MTITDDDNGWAMGGVFYFDELNEACHSRRSMVKHQLLQIAKNDANGNRSLLPAKTAKPQCCQCPALPNNLQPRNCCPLPTH